MDVTCDAGLGVKTFLPEFDMTETGLVLVIAGPPELASASALGQIFRSLGREWRIAVFQENDEVVARDGIVARDFPKQLSYFSIEDSYFREKLDQVFQSGVYELVVINGLDAALNQAGLSEEDFIALQKKRNSKTYVFITVEQVSEVLSEAADLVTQIDVRKQ
jgi:ATP:corrinoid adenosyltransferase